jgi:hypothetical protein
VVVLQGLLDLDENITANNNNVYSMMFNDDVQKNGGWNLDEILSELCINHIKNIIFVFHGISLCCGSFLLLDLMDRTRLIVVVVQTVFIEDPLSWTSRKDVQGGKKHSTGHSFFLLTIPRFKGFFYSFRHEWFSRVLQSPCQYTPS